jgi:hypothetical protein
MFDASLFIADPTESETAITIPGRDCRIRAVYGEGFILDVVFDPAGAPNPVTRSLLVAKPQQQVPVNLKSPPNPGPTTEGDVFKHWAASDGAAGAGHDGAWPNSDSKWATLLHA